MTIDFSQVITAEAKAAQALAERTEAARNERDARLAQTDWIVIASTERGEPVPEAWAAYRQALRDVTDQPGFPDAIDWPEAPA